MKRATETRAKPRGLAVFAVALVVLSGCDDALLSQDASSEARDETSDSNKTELLPSVSSDSKRDIEAPEVFEVTEAGLWDGRPSLGGIWVAHPDVTQPERVVIKNASNSKTVVGALFRRERNLPGPALQVSSAAAEQLGMLAGAPTKIQVVALRREVIEEPPAEPETDDSQTEAPDTDTAEATTETSADASAEETTAEADKPEKRKWWQKKKPAAAAGATGAAVAATDETAEAATEVASATAAASPSLTDAPVAAPVEQPAKRKWWQKKPRDEITETPLDPIAGAAAAIDAAEPTPAAASTSTLSKPFVQIGTFGVEANANSAAEKIRRNGMSAQVRALETEDKTVWRVLVGPAATRADRRAIQNDVKDLGFTDAFTVSN